MDTSNSSTKQVIPEFLKQSMDDEFKALAEEAYVRTLREFSITVKEGEKKKWKFR